ncbi:hypothetical protein LCGC14_0871520 [marine sediment metagenome]|uniref:Uncharacterized protein n=1 Tax=marine sediment metagenome TaxID=412755 RepID=A0A0F9P9B9_9ZZZZ|nr:hypothetical protein [bacterium]
MFGDPPFRKRNYAHTEKIPIDLFWSKGNSMRALAETHNKRVSLQNITFALHYTNNFIGFKNIIDTTLLDMEKFRLAKQEVPLGFKQLYYSKR